MSLCESARAPLIQARVAETGPALPGHYLDQYPAGNARGGHPGYLPSGVFRAPQSRRAGGIFAFPVGAPAPVTSSWYWALLGFDLAMRVRNAVWRPPFVMYYRTYPNRRAVGSLTTGVPEVLGRNPGDGAGSGQRCS